MRKSLKRFVQIRNNSHRDGASFDDTNGDSSVWALEMKDNKAGKVMNFKVVVRKGTKPAEVRYCEQFNQSNAFLLKYFNYSCYLCERLTSHIWTASSNCYSCEQLF